MTKLLSRRSEHALHVDRINRSSPKCSFYPRAAPGEWKVSQRNGSERNEPGGEHVVSSSPAFLSHLATVAMLESRLFFFFLSVGSLQADQHHGSCTRRLA